MIIHLNKQPLLLHKLIWKPLSNLVTFFYSMGQVQTSKLKQTQMFKNSGDTSTMLISGKRKPVKIRSKSKNFGGELEMLKPKNRNSLIGQKPLMSQQHLLAQNAQ